MCFYCVKCCVSPVELSVMESVVDPSLGVKVCILLCCVLVNCCDLKDVVQSTSTSSPTVVSEVRRTLEVPRDVMEGVEVSFML